MAQIKITLDTGPGGELRDYVIDQEVLRRLLVQARFGFNKLRYTEGSDFPTNDRAAETLAAQIMFDFKMY
jgi:hypothetical protein